MNNEQTNVLQFLLDLTVLDTALGYTCTVYSFVNTRKFCGFAKAKGFIIFL